MKIIDSLSDAVVLEELGQRLARRRIELGLTQAEAADEAGISVRTVTRIEAGESAQLSSWIRLLRALGQLDALEQLLPSADASPMEQLRRQQRGRSPQRVRKRRAKTDADWRWGDES